MKKLMYLLLALTSLGGQTVEAVTAKTNAPGFVNLPAAVAFIASCLETQDFAKLTQACLSDAQPPAKHVLTQLKQKHEEQPLPKRYAAKAFPAKGTAFKLGGHDSELGNIHVDFSKQGDRWYLEHIWMCR